MNLAKSKEIKGAIETFFYKIRLNIGLIRILKSKRFYEFRDIIEKSLEDQIMFYAKFEKVNEIVGFEKATRELSDQFLLNNLEKIWLPILLLLKREEVKQFLINFAEEGGQEALNKLRIDEEFLLTNDSLLENISNRIEDFAFLIDNTTKSWIAKTVEEGINKGMGNFEIAKVIRDSASKTAAVRADIIAEYEVAKAVGEMSTQVFIKNGATEHKWITSRDERVCLVCVANEKAGVLKIGALFPNGTTNTPAHPNCRCYTLPIKSEKIEDIWAGQ